VVSYHNVVFGKNEYGKNCGVPLNDALFVFCETLTKAHHGLLFSPVKAVPKKYSAVKSKEFGFYDNLMLDGIQHSAEVGTPLMAFPIVSIAPNVC